MVKEMLNMLNVDSAKLTFTDMAVKTLTYPLELGLQGPKQRFAALHLLHVANCEDRTLLVS